ncbi:MAG: hypothetical protein ACKVXR_01075 [Planctomycetota bacterium]
MKAIATKTTNPEFCWNERGQIGCVRAGHSPFEGSEAWVRERWVWITPRLAAGVKIVLGREPGCDQCAAGVRE